MSIKLMTNRDEFNRRTSKFPAEFDQKVDMSKVNLPIIKKWIADELARILNSDDDVVPELVFNMLEASKKPNIKEMQISLRGFLNDDAPKFCLDLWRLCLSAQKNEKGIPQELVEAKKAEIIQEKAEEMRAREAAERRRQEERERDMEMERIRERERNERSRGRGGRFGREPDRRPRRDSRSPPLRHRDGDDAYRAPTRGDSYIPPSNRGRCGYGPPRRHRSPSSSRSRSRSPPRRRRRRSPSFDASRSPPQKRRADVARSVSRDRGKQEKRGEIRTRSRSPVKKNRSPSPRRHRPHRRSPSISDRSRSPPSKRTGRWSTSGSPPRGGLSRDKARSRTRLPPSQRRKRGGLAPDDLMSGGQYQGKRREPRLSRDPSTSRSPPRKRRQRNTSSPESDAQESGHSFLGAAARQAAPSPSIQAPPAQGSAEILRRLELLKQRCFEKGYGPNFEHRIASKSPE